MSCPAHLSSSGSECSCVHGLCDSGTTGSGQCTCFSGYKGPNCDQGQSLVTCGASAGGSPVLTCAPVQSYLSVRRSAVCRTLAVWRTRRRAVCSVSVSMVTRSLDKSVSVSLGPGGRSQPAVRTERDTVLCVSSHSHQPVYPRRVPCPRHLRPHGSGPAHVHL